jgi:PmbA protein
MSTSNPPTAATPALTLDTLAGALAATPGADEWQAEITTTREIQRYVIGAEDESARAVTSERARVRVLNDHPAHGATEAAAAGEANAETADGAPAQARGWSTVTVLATDAADPARLAARLGDATFMAGLTDNPSYHLPGMPAGGFPVVETVDPELAGPDPFERQAERALQAARDELERAIAAEPGVRLSSAELYLSRETRTLRNSHGLACAGEGTHVFLDAILIASDGTHEAEVHVEQGRRRLSDLQIGATIRAYAGYARDTLRAATPPTLRGPVVISGSSLSDLLGPLVFHASAQAKFLGISRFAPGELVTSAPPRGDRLSLATDATLPYGARTARCDAEGVPGARVALVEDGVLRAYWAEQRYAQYLDVPATGAVANLVVGLGETATADFWGGEPVYEIVDFSWMNPDPITGEFASEIRLGYRHDPDGTVTPIKGGTLAGNVFEALAGVRFAREALFTGNYYGPAAMRFEELSIAGE